MGVLDLDKLVDEEFLEFPVELESDLVYFVRDPDSGCD